MSAQYSLTVQNQSTNEGDICVYQTNSKTGDPGLMSLAWLTEHVFPTTTVKFGWNLDYCFVWDETGLLSPDLQFEAGQAWPAKLSGNNKVTLTYKDGAFTFTNQEAGPVDGQLFILQDGTIPVGKASVGIGMARSATFAVQALPNMNLVFTPHPAYWVTFGNFKQGQVLSTKEITNAAQIQFPPNIYAMTATLHPDNTWSVVPTQG